MSLVLAFDVGTSSVRTALYDFKANRLKASVAQQGYVLKTTMPGMAELSPKHLLAAARRCLNETLATYDRTPSMCRQPIEAVSMSCFWHSLMGVATDGGALTPIYTWADSRSQVMAERLRQELDGVEVHRRTGCMLHSSFWPAKLAWLQQENRSQFGRIHHWMSPGQWLYLQLAGLHGCAHGMATGTGLYDPTKQAWDGELLERFRVSQPSLGEIDDGGRQATRLNRGHAALSDALWYPAIGDGAASNLGSGADRKDTFAINLGSSAAVREVHTGKVCRAPLGLFAYRIDTSRFLLGGAISNAGNLRTWCLRQLRLGGSERQLDRLLAARRRPDHGLTILPFWTAERAPTWRDDLLGTIQGLTQHTDALDILRASVEAGHHRLAQIIALMKIKPAAKLIVSGGGSKGITNQRRLADVLGREVFVSAETEASLRGAAVRAIELAGGMAPPPRIDGPVAPDKVLQREFLRQRKAQGLLEEQLYSGS